MAVSREATILRVICLRMHAIFQFQTFGYAVCGRFLLADDKSVVIVRTVVTPRLTLAGVAFRSNQNDVNDIKTIKDAGK